MFGKEHKLIHILIVAFIMNNDIMNVTLIWWVFISDISSLEIGLVGSRSFFFWTIQDGIGQYRTNKISILIY